MKHFDEYMKEYEEKYPEEMAEARVWAKEFIARWKEDASLVNVKPIILEYDIVDENK